MQELLDQDESRRIIAVSAGVPAQADQFVDFIAKYRIEKSTNPRLFNLIAIALTNIRYELPVLKDGKVSNTIDGEGSFQEDLRIYHALMGSKSGNEALEGLTIGDWVTRASKVEIRNDLKDLAV